MKDEETLKILSGEQRLDTGKILDKLQAQLKDYKNVSSYKLRRGKVEINSHIGRVAQIPNREQVLNDYGFLLKDKIKDKTMQRDVIRFWEILGQKRCNDKIILVTNRGNHPEIVCYGTMPEARYKYAQFWYNRVIDSNNFRPLVQHFLDTMRTDHGLMEVHINRLPSQPCQVQSTYHKLVMI